MDLDGDGRLSLYELEYFYQEQTQRMECLGLQAMPFEDALCQMVDMIKPVRDNYLTLGDLKRSQAVGRKYLCGTSIARVILSSFVILLALNRSQISSEVSIRR